MLTPEYLQQCSEYGEELAAELHEEIISAIVRRIEASKGNISQTDINLVGVLEQAGYLRTDIEKILAKRLGMTYRELAKSFKDAGLKSFRYEDSIYRKAGLPVTDPTQSPYFMRLVQRNYDLTCGTVANLTDPTIEAGQKLFIKACNKYYNLTASGAMSLTEAYRKAINETINEGLRITYTDGFSQSIESATLSALRTGISQMSAQITLARMEENSCDLVIVSSHLGARPSHYEWQGKVYSRSGKDKKYPDFVSSTGYGTVDGLSGRNCRHSVQPFFEGQGNPFEQYDREENQRLYDQTQRQRALERSIRYTKRRLANQESLDDPNGEEVLRLQNLLKKQSKAYTAYCRETGLRPLRERLLIARAGGIENTAPEMEVKVFRDENSALGKKIGADIYNQCLDVYEAAPDSTAKRIYEKFLNDVEVAETDATRVYNGFRVPVNCYNTRDRQLHLNLDEWKKQSRNTGEILFHESGHYFDYRFKDLLPPAAFGEQRLNNYAERNFGLSMRYKNGLFPETIKKEMNGILKDWQKKKGCTKKEARAYIEDWLRFYTHKEAGSLKDIVEGASTLTGGTISSGSGHGKAYWMLTGQVNSSWTALEKKVIRNEMLAAEAFAEMMEAHISSPACAEKIKEWFPESWKLFEEMMEEFYGKL